MQTNDKTVSVETEKENKINETLSVIYSRRAVRRYKDKPVNRTLIEQVIGAGRMAPSAMNMQPWKFYVLNDKGEIKSFSNQIAKASVKGIAKTGVKGIAKAVSSALLHPHDLSFFKGDDFIFHGAPVVIFITAPKDNEWAGLDIGACAQNMMLAAKSFGLDTCPVGLAKFVENTQVFPKLNISKKDHVMLAVILGYGDETPEMHERKRNNLFYIF
jgi:nitroreductase